MRNSTFRAFAAGTLTGALLTATLTIAAAPARADVTDTQVAHYEQAVCATLDDYPTFAGIIGIGVALHDKFGVDYYDAGQIIGASVFSYCPRHTDLVLAFANANDLATA